MSVHDGFGDQDWFDAWYEAFAPRARRFPIGLTSEDFQPELHTGMSRLLRLRWRFLIAPVNAHSPQYGWKLTEPPAIDGLSDMLFEALRASRCHGIEIGLVPERGATARLFGRLAQQGGWIVTLEGVERTAVIEVDGDWDGYWQARSSNLKGALGKQGRQLDRLGRVSFCDSAQAGEWHDCLERGLALEASGWKGQQGTAILQRPDEARFYRRLAEAAAVKRRLRLFALSVDDRMIAFYFTIVEGDALFWLKVAYDERLSRYGPAMLLFRRALAACFDDPSIRVAYVAGAPTWTHRWTERAEQLVTVRAIPSRSFAGLAARAEALARGVHRRVMIRNRGE